MSHLGKKKIIDSKVPWENGCFQNRGTPKSCIFNRVFHEKNHPFGGKKSPYFWVQHPYVRSQEGTFVGVFLRGPLCTSPHFGLRVYSIDSRGGCE